MGDNTTLSTIIADLEERIRELERRVAALERQLAERPQFKSCDSDCTPYSKDGTAGPNPYEG